MMIILLTEVPGFPKIVIAYYFLNYGHYYWYKDILMLRLYG